MNDRENAEKLIEEIREGERILTEKRELLQKIYQGCKHQWSKPLPEVVVRPQITFPLTSERSECVKNLIRWTRKCSECGKCESTTDTKEEITRIPKFQD